MIMPGDNAELNVELITPIAMEERPALRHPRRRPHRRRRRRGQDHRVARAAGAAGLRAVGRQPGGSFLFHRQGRKGRQEAVAGRCAARPLRTPWRPWRPWRSIFSCGFAAFSCGFAAGSERQRFAQFAGQVADELPGHPAGARAAQLRPLQRAAVEVWRSSGRSARRRRAPRPGRRPGPSAGSRSTGRSGRRRSTSSSASSAAAIAPRLSTWSRGIRWRRLEVATNSTFIGGPETPPSSADFSALAAAAPSSNDRSSHSTTNRSWRPRSSSNSAGRWATSSRSISTSFSARVFAGGGHERGLGQRALAGAAHAPEQHMVGWQAARRSGAGSPGSAASAARRRSAGRAAARNPAPATNAPLARIVPEQPRVAEVGRLRRRRRKPLQRRGDARQGQRVRLSFMRAFLIGEGARIAKAGARH